MPKILFSNSYQRGFVFLKQGQDYSRRKLKSSRRVSVSATTTLRLVLKFQPPTITRQMEMEKEKENQQQEVKYLFGLHLLPTDIAANILCRLPNIDSILGCKLVCKTWYALISDPVFVDTHTHRFLKDLDTNSFILQGLLTPYQDFHYGEYHADNIDEFIPDRFKVYQQRSIIDIGQHNSCEPWPFMAGSCNGLVCLGSNRPYSYWNGPTGEYIRTYKGWFYVCNPVTREYLHIPIEEYTFYGRIIKSFAMATGFGYHASTKEYKIVRVVYANDDDGVKKSMVHVYTLGSGRWRSKGEINHLLGEINHSLTRKYICSYDRNSIGICVNGALYWVNEKMEIISFDLADEEFRIVSVTRPSCFNETDEYGVLGGCLCLTQHDYDIGIMKIWVMNLMMIDKEKKKEEYSWIEKFTIRWDYMYRSFQAPIPFALLSDGNILLHSMDCNYIVSYDPKSGSIASSSEGEGFFVDEDYRRMFPYMKSIVSLKALQEKDETARKLINTAAEE